jgi:hypothetical protein
MRRAFGIEIICIAVVRKRQVKLPHCERQFAYRQNLLCIEVSNGECAVSKASVRCANQKKAEHRNSMLR